MYYVYIIIYNIMYTYIFRKGRGCRDQLLTLMLLAKMKMTAKKRGMFGAFIDLKKAYDTIDQAKLWAHLQSMHGARRKADNIHGSSIQGREV